jgi:hypothetical protein
MRNTMRITLALTFTAALAAIAAVPARAEERVPAIPDEQGVRLVGSVGWRPYRCTNEPVHNFYHDALYDGPPAIYRRYAYRTFYRYKAWRVTPRTFVCAEE